MAILRESGEAGFAARTWYHEIKVFTGIKKKNPSKAAGIVRLAVFWGFFCEISPFSDYISFPPDSDNYSGKKKASESPRIKSPKSTSLELSFEAFILSFSLLLQSSEKEFPSPAEFYTFPTASRGAYKWDPAT